MSCAVAILATTHLVRQTVAQPLAPLGFRLHEFADLSTLALRVNDVAPHLVVMDLDGLQGAWRALAAALRASPKRVALVLLAGRFGFDEAHEALAIGVSGMILKPFRKEEHTARLSEICLRARGLRPRRAAPRFVLPADAAPHLLYDGPAGEERSAVADISLGGLGLRPDRSDPGAVLAPGSTLSRARLPLQEGEVLLSVQVVHRDGGRAGVRVLRLLEGRPSFLRALQAQHARAFGTKGKRNRW